MAWHSQGYTATLQLNAFVAATDVTRPCRGLADVVVAGQHLAAARLLGVAAFTTADAASVRPIDHYVRGADLVVAYEEPGQWPVHVDALWRATAPAAADEFLAALDLVVSVRTQLLDSRPELLVQSAIPAHEVLRLQDLHSAHWAPLAFEAAAPLTLGPENGTGCLLFRISDGDLGYVEMVHPADFQYDQLSRDESSGGTLRIAHRLFHTNLEKGVILRARVRGMFLNRRGDTEIAARHFAAFAGVEPPLGT